MTQRFLLNAVVGTLADRPTPNNAAAGATEAPYGLYVDVDTGDVYEATGSAWVHVGTLAGNGATSITGLASDSANGITVTANVHAASVTAASQVLTGTAAGTVVSIEQAAAGQSANIHEFRDSTGQVLVEIDAHGNIVGVALAAPGAPTKGAKTAGDITGTAYQWACALVNAQGETTLGTKTSTTALTAQRQSLTMPVSAPDGCTFNLYRNASAGSEWDQVTTGLAPGAVYVDDTLDVALGDAAPAVNTTAPVINGVPGLTADGETPPGAVLLGNFIANSVNGNDPNTLNSFAGGITVGDQGVSISANNGVDALDVFVADGGDVSRLCFRANADQTQVRIANVDQFLVDVDGATIRGKVRVGSSATHTLGAYSGKSVPIYDESGTLLGYMPLYA